MRGLVVSVDTDGPEQYRSIYGLTSETGSARFVWRVAHERMLQFAQEQGITLSLFVIGSQVRDPEFLQWLRQALVLGHHAECHSDTHDYALSRRSAAAIATEVREGFDRIADATGQRPQGFRAPGYVLSAELLEAVIAAGGSFDSSVLPCPAYYAAKAAVRLGLRVTGRPSGSVLDSPRAVFAPTQPYLPSRDPYRAGSLPLWEIPIGVTPALRLPLIGTFVGPLGARLAAALARSLASAQVCHLSLHAIDFLARREADADLVRLPELHCSLERRLASFGGFVSEALRRGHPSLGLRQLVPRG